MSIENLRTKNTTLLTIMYGKGFSKGFNHARKGKPYSYDMYSYNTEARWNYERGRAFGVLWGGDLKDNNKITRLALYRFSECVNDGSIR